MFSTPALSAARRKRKVAAGLPKRPGQGDVYAPVARAVTARAIPASRMTGKFGGRGGGIGGRGTGGAMSGGALASLFYGGVRPSGAGGSYPAPSFYPASPVIGGGGRRGGGGGWAGSARNPSNPGYRTNSPFRLGTNLESTAVRPRTGGTGYFTPGGGYIAKPLVKITG